MSAILGAAHRRNMGGFIPTDIAGCNPWFDAGQITGLNNGDPVANWLDESGNSNDAVQADVAKEPLYETGVINGKPALQFDGSNDYLLASTVSIAQPNTFFIVGKSSVTPYNYEFFFDGAVSRQAFLYSAANVGAFAGSLAFTGTPDTAWHIFSIIFNGSSSEIYDNGVLISTVNTGANALTGLVIGYDLGDDGFGLNGYIAEIIGYDTALGTSNRQAVEAYLATKYAL